MNKERKGKISGAIMHCFLDEKIPPPEHPGFSFILHIVKNINEIAKETGINVGELWDYIKIVDMERREEPDECK